MSTQARGELQPDVKRVVKKRFTDRVKTSIAILTGLIVLGIISSAIAAGISGVINVTSLVTVGAVALVIFLGLYVAVLYAVTRDSTVVYEDKTVTTYRVDGEQFFIDDTGTTLTVYKPIKYTNDRDTINAHDGVVILHEYPVTVKSGHIHHTTYGYMDTVENISLETAAVLVTQVTEHTLST